MRGPGQSLVQTRGLLSGSKCFEFPKSIGNKLRFAPVFTNSVPPPHSFLFVCFCFVYFLWLSGSSGLILMLNLDS